MENDFRVILEAVIDNSSLTDIQKKLAKEYFKANIDVELDIDAFAKQKKTLQHSIAEMSKYMKQAFSGIGITLNDKDAITFSKEFFNAIKAQTEVAKKAQREQEALNERIRKGKELAKKQANDSFTSEQSSIYGDIIRNQEKIYALKTKLLSADQLETEEINKQIHSLEVKNKYNREYKLSNKGMIDSGWEKTVQASQKALENQYRLVEARKTDIKIEKEIVKAQRERSKALEFTRKESERLSTAKKKIQPSIDNGAYSTQIDGMVAQFKKYGLSSEEAKAKVKELRETLKSMETAPSSESLVANFEKWEQQIKDANVELTKFKLAYDKIAEVDKIKLSLDDGSYDSKVESLIEKTRRWTDENGNARISTVNLSDTLLNLNTAFEKGLSKEEIINLARTLDSEMNKVTNSIRKMNAEYAKDSEILSFNKQVTEFYDKNSKAHAKFGNALRKMMNDTSVGAKRTNAELDEMKKNFIDIQSSARQTGKLGLSFFDSIKQQASKFVQWFGVSSIVTTGIGQFKKMYQAILDIDTAMNNLYKVTDETDDRYTKFLDNACDKAGELGRTVSSLVEQTANWSKLGYNLDDAEKLAEISSIYANVGEVDDETAVSDMVTAMKAFNIEASNAITIVDRLNTLGNKYATSAKDLGTGLSNSASALALAGNSIDETLAMITAMTEITQDASESGNALKILSMRLRGMKGELEALGEESDGLESISKIQTQILNLTGGKVNIFDDNGNFQSTFKIMQGISEVWTEISQTDQAELLEIIAGKQRGNSISALLTNMAQANNALNDSLKSSGSAYEEQSRWLESMEAKTKQFQAAFESLSNTILDSDLLKFFVDLGTASLNTINEIISGLGSLGTLFAGGLGAGAIAFFKNLD